MLSPRHNNKDEPNYVNQSHNCISKYLVIISKFMSNLIKEIYLIERVDQLIRLGATGCPDEFIHTLGITKTKLFRTIHTMKELGAPISYNFAIQSYVYEQHVGFKFGFYAK